MLFLFLFFYYNSLWVNSSLYHNCIFFTVLILFWTASKVDFSDGISLCSFLISFSYPFHVCLPPISWSFLVTCSGNYCQLQWDYGSSILFNELFIPSHSGIRSWLDCTRPNVGKISPFSFASKRKRGTLDSPWECGPLKYKAWGFCEAF